jgi:hypothetical protein
MEKAYTYEEYDEVVDSYFSGEFDKEEVFDELKTKDLFKKVLRDYLDDTIDMTVVGLVASDLYWYLNDNQAINNSWDPKLAKTLRLCSDAHYLSSALLEGDESVLPQLQEIVDDIELNWEAKLD